MKIKYFVLCMLLAALLSGCRQESYLQQKQSEQNEQTDQDESLVQTREHEDSENASLPEEKDDGKKQGSIWIQVSGAVVSPGVYKLPEASRIYDGIVRAGGFAEGACDWYLNQAEMLRDGQKIYVPTFEELQSDDERVKMRLAREGISDGERLEMPAEASASVEDGRININVASVEELQTLTGIGATRAEAIVAYRNQHGSFSKPEDLKQVSGIGESTYEKIASNIKV